MSLGARTQALLAGYATLFWDFDGVVKESVSVKADAFERLFAPFGAALAAQVRCHHEQHGGMSRTQKLPLYLAWTGCAERADEVSRYAERFSALVRQAVVDCPWVPGAREYLAANCRRQRLVLVTATPQAEIEDILDALSAREWFAEVYGVPTAKAEALQADLARSGCQRDSALMIGDSEADHAAAQAAGVAFLLRRTAFNRPLQRAYAGPQCEDFL
jgi:HAD superfamily hydrolase (TIGR01549 family)